MFLEETYYRKINLKKNNTAESLKKLDIDENSL